MSFYASTNHGEVHIGRVNAEKIGKRGIFINVTDDNARTQSEHQTASFIRLRNNLNISPGERRREAFTKTFSKNIIFDCLKPIYNFLRAMGVFPLSRRDDSGEFHFHIQSPIMLYSLLVFVALITYTSLILPERINTARNHEGKFVEAVIAYLFIVNLLPIIIVPMMWYESTKIALIMNDWADLETIYSKIVGKPLRVELKRKALFISIVLPLLSTLSVLLTHYVIRKQETKIERMFLFQVGPYCFLDTLTYGLGSYWYMCCEFLSHTARVMADNFQKALKNVGPAAIVADYRSLWLRLSKLTKDTGTATCFTFTFINLYLFFVITLSSYGLMSQASEGFGVKDIGLAITVFCSVGLLFFICDEGHNASFNVKTIFQKKILMVELTWMNSDATVEINMFLRATEMSKANMNLGGFFDVNRNLFKSLLATMVTFFLKPSTWNNGLESHMGRLLDTNKLTFFQVKLAGILKHKVTYLVVLLQFQISIPSDEVTALNRNTSSYET